MNAKCALVKALLDGKVLNIKNCFEMIGLTNAPREISRMIEKPFGVEVFRVDMKGKSRYGSPVVWVNYRLPKTEQNKAGIKLMRDYLAEHYFENKQPVQGERFSQPELFLK